MMTICGDRRISLWRPPHLSVATAVQVCGDRHSLLLWRFHVVVATICWLLFAWVMSEACFFISLYVLRSGCEAAECDHRGNFIKKSINVWLSE